MADKTTVIYAGRTMQDAHLLRNLLADEGIQAVVINDLLQGGSGVDIVGWPTAARVVVAEQDAPRARQIAVEFDRRAAAAAQENAAAKENQPEADAAEEHVREPAADWPACPQCGARRMTRCPVCGTAGTQFPSADMDFSGLLGLPEAPPSTCHCGPGGCTPATPTSQEAASEPQPGVPPQRMLTCTTCDEPFVPEYPRRCEWCGHTFADGYEVDVTAAPAADEEGEDSRVEKGILAILFTLVTWGEYPSLWDKDAVDARIVLVILALDYPGRSRGWLVFLPVRPVGCFFQFSVSRLNTENCIPLRLCAFV